MEQSREQSLAGIHERRQGCPDGALGLGAGVTMKQLKAHYEKLQQERKAFEEFTNPPKGLSAANTATYPPGGPSRSWCEEAGLNLRLARLDPNLESEIP